MKINKARIQELIIEGKLDKAVELLLALSKNYDENLYQKIIYQSSRLNGLSQEIQNGTISNYDASLTRNQINLAIIKQLTDINPGWQIKSSSETRQEKRLVKILFLAADPSDASRLRLMQEHRKIHEKLQLSKERDNIILAERLSVRPADISQAILDEEPNIVHFSGHGSSDGNLAFEDEVGKIKSVSGTVLSALFSQFSDIIDCVILNACHSKFQSSEIGKYIKFVIGMNQAIGDSAAIAFSSGFYQALGAGKSYEKAFALGCIQIGLQGFNEDNIPILISRKSQL